jgi:hypothetical protein
MPKLKNKLKILPRPPPVPQPLEGPGISFCPCVPCVVHKYPFSITKYKRHRAKAIAEKRIFGNEDFRDPAGTSYVATRTGW